MAKMRARRISGSRWVTRSGSRPSGIARASRSAMPSRRSAWASNMTPPSELIRPPSKAAVIFLRRTAGKQNGRRLSSVMAGVRASIPAKGWLQQPNPTPDQQLTLLPPPLIRPRHEYDRLVDGERLYEVRPAELREHFTTCAEFVRWDVRNETWKPTNCPEDIARTYGERRGRWKLRPLAGIVTAPTLRGDGSILDQPGY